MTVPVLIVFMVLPLLALAVIAGLVVLAVRLSAGSGGRSGPPLGPGQRYARVFRPEQAYALSSQYDSSQYGRLTITEQQLLWHPHEGTPWATPISAVTVLGTTGVISGGDPHVDVEIAGSGRWRLVVSTRTVNRFVSNDFKRFREAGEARALTDHLLRHGARRA